MSDSHAQADQRLEMVAFYCAVKVIDYKQVNDREQANLVPRISVVLKPLKVLVQLHRVPNRFKGDGRVSYSY